MIALRRALGVRQVRAIPFLPRDNAVNVRLGRVLRKLKDKMSVSEGSSARER